MELESLLIAATQMFERWVFCVAVIISTDSLLALTINRRKNVNRNYFMKESGCCEMWSRIFQSDISRPI